MAKVFIADPALKSHHGHHYAVTRKFSDAVVMTGVETVWLVNKSFNISQEDRQAAFKIDLAFTEDTYDGYKKKQVKPGSAAMNTVTVPYAQMDEQSRFVMAIKGKLQCAPKTVRVAARTIYRLAEGRPVNLRDPHPVVHNSAAVYPPLRPELYAVIKRKFDYMPRPVRLAARTIYRFIKGRPINIHHPHPLAVRHAARTMIAPAVTANAGIKVLRPEQEIYRALCRHGFTSEDCVIFHTCDAHTYRDVLALYVNVLLLAQWNNLPFFVLSTPYDMEIMPHNKTAKKAGHSVLHLKSLGLLGSRIFLFAENELLAAQLSSDWNTNVSGLYIPYTGTKVLPDRRDNGPVTFTYLGAARTEKGFPVVAEVVAAFLSDTDRSDVRFVIQVSPQILGYTPDVKNAVNMLKSVDDNRLMLIEDVQSPEEYQQALQQADVLFLAYEKSRYTVRSSGIAIEAIENGKNVIATSGTFLSYVAGDAAISISDPGDISAAITRLLENIDIYRDEALARRTWLLEKCSVSKVHDLLRLGKEIMIGNYMFKYLRQDIKSVYKLRWRRLL